MKTIICTVQCEIDRVQSVGKPAAVLHVRKRITKLHGGERGSDTNAIHVLVHSLVVTEKWTVNRVFTVRTYSENKSIVKMQRCFGMTLMSLGMAEFLHVMPF